MATWEKERSNYTGLRSMMDHLKDYLRRILRGERVVITDRGRSVAAIGGLEEQEGSEVGRSLVRQGVGE